MKTIITDRHYYPLPGRSMATPKRRHSIPAYRGRLVSEVSAVIWLAFITGSLLGACIAVALS